MKTGMISLKNYWTTRGNVAKVCKGNHVVLLQTTIGCVAKVATIGNVAKMYTGNQCSSMVDYYRECSQDSHREPVQFNNRAQIEVATGNQCSSIIADKSRQPQGTSVVL